MELETLLRPLIEEIVRETIKAIPRDDRSDEPIAYREAKAAEMLGLRPNQLKSLRLANRISYSRGPRGIALYTRQDLEDFLDSRREKQDAHNE